MKKLASTRPKSGAENVYRNLALNPDDIQGDGEMQTEYPHAVSNSEYAYLAAAAAKNAIDGDPETSWTPNLRTDAWLNVDFGHEVEIDKVVVQFAEGVDKESSARTTTVEFSDGSTETIKLMPTSEPQAFTFDKRRVVRVRLVGFVEEELPPTSFSVAELEVWGVSVE